MNESADQTKPQRTVLKKLRRTIGWLFLILALATGALLGLLFIYEDEVKAAIIAELNKHLKAEVKIDPKNIDLTIIRTFPDCSIQFKDVLILEALPLKQRDTLIFAGRLNLHFSIKDLWNKKYAIQKIKLREGVLKPRVLANGKTNYLIWEQKDDGSNTEGDLNFNLDLLKIENCRLDYRDLKSGFVAQLLLNELDFKGNFKATDFELRSEAKLKITKLSHKKRSLLQNKDCTFLLDLNVAGNRYTIKTADLRLNRLQIDLNGGFTFKDSLDNLDLTYKAPKLDIASALSLLPTAYKDKMNDYESTGNFYASGNLHYSAKNKFSIDSDFGIKNGAITYKPQSTTINRVELDGHLKYNNKASSLEIKKIYLQLNSDELKGAGLISDFANPTIRFNGAADLDLANLYAFWPIDTLKSLSGNLKISAAIDGLLQDLQKQTFSSKVKLDLSASVKNLEAQFKNDEHLFSVESGSIMAFERQVEVQNLKLKRGSSDVLLNGKLPGFFNYLAEPGSPLVITGNLFSNNIRMEDFMIKYKASGGESDLIPPNITFKLNADIQKFSYAKFSATAIKGEIEVKNQKAIISDMSLKTMEGSATIDAFADNAHNRLNVVLQSKLENINIRELFSEFNNFGQATLVDKNVKGHVSADIEFSGNWNNQLDVDLSSIRSSCNLNIERGELIDFKPLVSLSKFVEFEDLRHIRFSTLQSEVQIRNKVITLPKTVLMNSALNIIFSGTHSFDNEIDYHIRLVISELLAKKRKPDDEFGPVEEDKEKRRGAYILMTGTIDNPVKKFDRKGQKEKIREDIKEEKQTVKRVLKEELGLFKKDELPPKQKKAEQKFELEKPDNNPPKKTLEPKKKPAEEDF
ncbi:MAG TPA: AsmA-like C-terminal region-containing protein [Bacteroidia bacterium]|nr:AsmA-like C-terminal region-containing protein [Bacteroidia bacterium]